jgi:anti-sigma factor RsiW
MNESVDMYREWDAAYVLGALSSDDRREYERHLAGCASCTTAVAEFAGMPGLLMKIDANTAQTLATVPEIQNVFALPLEPIQSLARAALRRRASLRKRMAAGLAVAASFIMVIGLLLGSQLGAHTSGAGSPASTVVLGAKVTMVAMEENSMAVDMRVSAKRWGTQFSWNCIYGNGEVSASKPQSYDLVITDAAGVATTVASWSQAGTSAKGLVASTGIPMSKIKTIEVQYADTHAPVVRGVV